MTESRGLRTRHWPAVGLALLAAGVAVWLGVAYRNQPLVEWYGFRQAQTAIASYWMQRGGPLLHYETPVVGAPWAIPLEFPLYQWIVAWISGMGLPLDATGRLVSLAALLLCLVPIHSIVRRLALDGSTSWIFAGLILSSPVYLFWGRSFSIETTALLFTLAALPFAIDVIRRRGGWRSPLYAGLFLTLALLQKITTAAPVLPLLAVFWARESWPHRRDTRLLLRGVGPAILAFCVPLAIAVAWSEYSSQVREMNPFGAQLTNSALFHWNFGHLAQRYSPALWIDVVWRRTIQISGGGWLGLAAVAGALIASRHARPILLSLLVLLLLPLLAFTNLHIVHDYYQVASTLYWLAALAVSVTEWARLRKWGRHLATLLTLLLMLHNYHEFAGRYWPKERQRFGGIRVSTLGIAEILAQHTEEDAAFVAFGFEWSSELGYYAKRRSFTVPGMFKGYADAWRTPERFLGGHRLGALVVCPTDYGPPGSEEVEARFAGEPGWWLLKAYDCQILLRPRQD